MTKPRTNPESAKMPALFLGHGSPLNAIADNEFTRSHAALAKQLPTPKAILMISAHWLTSGTWVTHMQQPRTIHDFGGFPKELFEVQYPAPGSPALAEKIQAAISNPQILIDDKEWGLDHGAWSVLKHLYPLANVPVVQLSIDMTQPFEFHFELGKKLRSLREQGVIIIGSGNIVHNLRRISWDERAPAADWSLEFDAWVASRIDARDFAPLVFEATKTEVGRLSMPTPDHYLPLLYVLGASDANDPIKHVTEGIQNASISMRSVQFG